MLSTLIALSSLTMFNAAGGQGESVFPKPEPRNPEVQRDRSIFQYLKESEQYVNQRYADRDWSGLKYSAPKADAIKLRVLLLVFERDFSNPAVSNTLELTDKNRLVQSMSRIRAYFSSISTGGLDVEVVPRFIPEPIFDDFEARQLLDKEFNKFAFDADDREERGPFAAAVVVTSSHASLSVGESFTSLGGTLPGDKLEQQLILNVCKSLTKNVSNRFAEPSLVSPFTYPQSWPVLRNGVALELLDGKFRNDFELIRGGTQAFAPRQEPSYEGVISSILGPAEMLSKSASESNVLVYTESTVLRSGFVPFPGAPVGVLEFKVRTKSNNPICFIMIAPSKGGEAAPTAEDVTIGADADIQVSPDGTWQTVRLGSPDGKASFIGFGATGRLSGVTRNPHEIIRYEFKEFKLVTDAPTPKRAKNSWDLKSATGVSQLLDNGSTEAKRLAIRAIISSPETFKSLQPKLLEMSTELEPAVAFGAVQAYGRIGIANDDLIGKAFMNRLVSTAPNEYAREAALLYFAEHPEQTTFEAISPNIVRRSWRTRIATVKALAALDKTDLKAKPAARQLLLTACGQDMAIIRSAALAAMKPDVDVERKQLEYSLVNDPSEQVRLQCLKQLGDANAPKEVLFGALADDSPYVREHVYEQLPANLKREALQRMVIDRDTYVRAAALYGFAKLPDPTQPGEIQNTFAEEHPAVLLALVEGAQKGKWKLPSNVIENAKKSKSPLVREGVAKLDLK